MTARTKPIAAVGELGDVVAREFSSRAIGSAVACETWDEVLLAAARSFVERPSKRFRARLVENTWWLLGQEAECLPPPLYQIVELVHAGSLIVDDIQDGSSRRRGAPSLHCEIGVGPAINTGNWLYFVGLSLVGRLGLDGDRATRSYQAITDAMFRCHLGQSLDLGVRVFALPRASIAAVVAETTALKTGALTELCGLLPAIVAGADEDTTAALRTFSRHLGVGLQMLDDVGSVRTRRDKGLEDLRQGRPTWPWAWLADGAADVDFARAARAAGAVYQGGDPDELFALLEEAATRGVAQARDHLRHALAHLTAHFGETAAVDAVRAELSRLEQSYG